MSLEPLLQHLLEFQEPRLNLIPRWIRAVTEHPALCLVLCPDNFGEIGRRIELLKVSASERPFGASSSSFSAIKLDTRSALSVHVARKECYFFLQASRTGLLSETTMLSTVDNSVLTTRPKDHVTRYLQEVALIRGSDVK
jgi:hypothetical protein